MLMAGKIPALVDICPENAGERILRIEKPIAAALFAVLSLLPCPNPI